ncbi:MULTISPECIES: PACE efflux transporter [unclassified Moritella]|uniref:PACE efflux transporter n=1 Tax=unclassified Moritella TaxID=2637987 RepID=UPI001BA9D3B9|nr:MULTISPECIES: PACE efflux transporter [unclassified Moritella]QUM83768.1 PACE efflux transporter [Moritella sp. 28]QUM88058.1 PACE efflux transporter [Moritella sp. 36]
MGTIERISQAVLFEVLAVTLSIIGLVLFTDHDIGSLSETMIVIASIAMVWNYLFNRSFDHFVKGSKAKRSFSLRIVHVILFEAGLLFFTIPVMAYILDVSLWQAFVMDLGVTIFITIYAFMFNLIYDHARVFVLQNRVVNA